MFKELYTGPHDGYTHVLLVIASYLELLLLLLCHRRFLRSHYLTMMVLLLAGMCTSVPLVLLLAVSPTYSITMNDNSDDYDYSAD